jgi:peptidoglycan/LPS O-acetylase OafA/YrhL
VVLDGLRGLAATAIVIHHFTADTGHGEVFASAGIAVDLFFCLSGAAFLATTLVLAHLLVVHVEEPVRGWLGARLHLAKA